MRLLRGPKLGYLNGVSAEQARAVARAVSMVG